MRKKPETSLLTNRGEFVVLQTPLKPLNSSSSCSPSMAGVQVELVAVTNNSMRILTGWGLQSEWRMVPVSSLSPLLPLAHSFTTPAGILSRTSGRTLLCTERSSLWPRAAADHSSAAQRNLWGSSYSRDCTGKTEEQCYYWESYTQVFGLKTTDQFYLHQKQPWLPKQILRRS